MGFLNRVPPAPLLAQAKDMNIVRFLVDAGASLQCENNQQQTALTIAQQLHLDAIADFLSQLLKDEREWRVSTYSVFIDLPDASIVVLIDNVFGIAICE